ncbi:MAG TPA: alpha/beta hydrolase [Jatrophihabitans sp.]|uniref:alpha/beta hydrolase n=1 Tax=Jatrophihabitans sp. TaxID=1932789 RepID=UPI002EEEBA1D
MPRRPTRTVPTVLLPDPFGAAEQDWQHWLAGQLSAAGRVVRVAAWPPPESADLAGCLAALRQSMAGLPDDGFDVLAHSAACLLWLHHAADTRAADTASAASGSPRPSRVALVAPPAPDRPLPAWDFLRPAPLAVDALRRAADGTVLVGGDNDPHCPGGVAPVYGAPLKMAATVIAGAGSLTAADGYGPWPAVLDWCGRDNLAFLA